MKNFISCSVFMFVLPAIHVSFPEDYDLFNSEYNGPIQSITEFKFDARGNWIKQVNVDDDGDYHIYQRVFKYYTNN